MGYDGRQSLILVVEDEPFVRIYGADVLEEAGFEVIEAGSADEALQVLAKRPDVCVVFTDVEMPGTLDGIELAWRVHERWPGISVVLTSGRRPPDPGVAPREDAFLPKPYAPSSLLREIESARSKSWRDGA